MDEKNIKITVLRELRKNMLNNAAKRFKKEEAEEEKEETSSEPSGLMERLIKLKGK